MGNLLRLALFPTVLLACGDDGGSTGGKLDAPANAPAMVMVTGTAEEITATGRTPQADVMIAAYKEGDQTPLAMTMSGADGTYTLTIPTGGVALDGYLLAKKSGLKDTYLYPPAVITADIPNAPVLLLSPTTFGIAPTLARATQDDGKGFIAMMVVDATQAPVGGATISVTPMGAGEIRYNNQDGLPNEDPVLTHTDGIAYVFNANTGDLTVGATKSGSTFTAHRVNARPDQLTTTLIQAQ